MDAGGNIPLQSETGNDLEVFCRSFALVAVAELFDKTWFMGLIFALRYGARVVFFGSFAALFLHCFAAAALGLAFAKFLAPIVLDYLTAILFFSFGILYAKDAYKADWNSDAIAEGKAEVSEEVSDEDPTEDQGGSMATVDGQAAGTEAMGDMGESEASTVASPGHMAANLDRQFSSDPQAPSESGLSHAESFETVELPPIPTATWASTKPPMEQPDLEAGGVQERRRKEGVSTRVAFAKSFMAVFIAEWGDRTQIAMIGQHASQPLVPVFLGSAAAFFLLTLSAVLAAWLLNGRKLRKRVIFGFSAACFLVFGSLSLKDAILASI